jgi:hypothetical protein
MESYCSLCTLSIGECPSNSPFLKNNGAEEWSDTRTFSNLNSTHCALLILLIINLVTKKSLCIVSKVQSIKLFAPCGTLKVQMSNISSRSWREQVVLRI